jgi:uncharacterized protein (DUF1800 family)
MNQLSFSDARHLTVRTGLGEEWRIIRKRQGRSRSEVINKLVRIRSDWAKPVPQLTPWQQWSTLVRQGGASQQQATRLLRRDKQALQEWWLGTMLDTYNPLVERMVMFWHNHFTSSLDKVNQPPLILKQNQLFRHLALGNFKLLLREVARDPAMMIYLDCNESGKGEANENFARELLELYTLGEGSYTEDDVRAAAKAFTGWGVDRNKQIFTFRKEKHDFSPITFLGRTGQLDGNDIIDILLKRPETAVNIAKKFWKEFINDDHPDMATINAWAGRFRGSNYEISALLKAVLNSRAFWTAENRGAKVKSPVELIVGTLRSLPIRVPTPKGSTAMKRLTNLCHSLGQKLFVPPDPAGWPGGNHWINTDTLNSRKNMLVNFTHINSQNTLHSIPQLSINELSEWLLANKAINPLPEESISNREKVHTLLLDPSYQLT